jgi:hypothetical protein
MPVPTDEQDSGVERPEGWPGLFTEPTAGCPHAYHWDDADGLYRCIYCDDTVEQPPDDKQITGV